jgi:hypothetical protein
MIIGLFLFIFFVISVRIYFAMSDDIDQKMQELQALRLEYDWLESKTFNETLSSNMKVSTSIFNNDVYVRKDHVDNKSGPIRWIKRDI